MSTERALTRLAFRVRQGVDEALGELAATSDGTTSETDVQINNREAMALLGVSRSTLQRYRSSGRIPYAVCGGRVRYRRSDVEALAAVPSDPAPPLS